MSSASPSRHELFGLIGSFCNGTLTLEEARRLEQALREDAAVRQFYKSYLRLHANLHLRATSPRAAAVSLLVPLETAATCSTTVRSTTVIGHLAGGWVRLGGISRAVALGISGLLVVYFALLIFSVVWDQAKWADRVDDRPHSFDGSHTTVATVSDTLDVTWSDKAVLRAKNAAVRHGDSLKISSGTMELKLKAGTELAVEGPADWSVSGKNSVSLRSGKLLARVPEQAIGFTVETPTARIVDLGTEFGVEVRESGVTDVHVVRGAVEVARSPSSSTTSKQSVKKRLVAGQAIRVTHAGVGDVATTSNAKSTLKGKTTAVAALDLVDIVAGGDGRGRRRDRGIDPATGRVVLMPDKDFGLFNHFPSGGYQRPDDRPFFIDGVGIPDPSHGPVQLNSAGHTFAGFPKTSGNTWGPLWAGGIVPDNPNAPKLRTTFDGKLDYSISPHGLIALIPNKLITFDLAALRREHRRYSLVKFRTVAGLSKPVPLPTVYKEGDGLADVWVFIDGELRFSRLGIRSADDPFTIELPLSPTARFLTVATTDGGNTVAFDWVFFGDPQIELEMKERK